MKYKLIKTYPGSPSIGTIIEFKHNSFWYVESDTEFTAFGCSHVLDYPEFWQPENKWKESFEQSVYQTIFDCVNIRGIELEEYKSAFENSNLFEELYKLFKDEIY